MKLYNENGVKIGAKRIQKTTNDMANRDMPDECRLTMAAHAVCYSMLPFVAHSLYFISHKKLSLLQYTLLKTSHLNKTYIKMVRKSVLFHNTRYTDEHFHLLLFCSVLACLLSRFCHSFVIHTHIA